MSIQTTLSLFEQLSLLAIWAIVLVGICLLLPIPDYSKMICQALVIVIALCVSIGAIIAAFNRPQIGGVYDPTPNIMAPERK